MKTKFNYKELVNTFREIDEEKAKLIIKLANYADNRENLEDLIGNNKLLEATDDYARSCLTDPYDSYMWRCTMALHAIDTLLETHGVEPIYTPEQTPHGEDPPAYEYCNTGDMYAATVIYETNEDELFISDWASIVEEFDV